MTGVVVLLSAALWVGTHWRDLPPVDDADLRPLATVAPEDDAGPALYRAKALLRLDDAEAKQIREWVRGQGSDDAAIPSLLSRNAPALRALAEAHGKTGLTIPVARRPLEAWEASRETPADPQPKLDVSARTEDLIAWRRLAWLSLAHALWLSRRGKDHAARDELLATARLGHLIEGAVGADVAHYTSAATMKSFVLRQLVEVAARARLSSGALRALASQVRMLGVNRQGFAATVAEEYRFEATAHERFAAWLQMRADAWLHGRPAPGKPPPSTCWSCGPLFLLGPFLYQPHRSEAVAASAHRAIQQDATQLYVARSTAPSLRDSLASVLRLLVGPNNIGTALALSWQFDWDSALARKCAENVRARAASTILLLLAYERDHGALPEHLYELVPAYADAVSINDFDGAPLRYSRERRRLWSVGADLVDEGGTDDREKRQTDEPTFSIPEREPTGSTPRAIATPETDPSDLANLNGGCLETLAGWRGDFREELGGALALAYRERSGERLFLLAKPSRARGACGAVAGHVIVATLRLPPLASHQWFAVNLDCHDPTGRVKKGDAIIGVFDKRNDRILPDPADRAWRVDSLNFRFEAVTGVACDSFS
jgi:hypothetical protein